MTIKWLPVEGGIVPRGDPSGPTQEEERFAALEGGLEDARGEYRLRRYDAAEAILARVISAAETIGEPRYRLLVASAYSLKGRIHWRRVERGIPDDAARQDEEGKQDAAFRTAIKLFRKHRRAITPDMPQSRLLTDYAIALFRTNEIKNALRLLKGAQATGVMAADAFAYLGLAHRELGDHEQAVLALKKGLQLAPGDRVLLENLAQTLPVNSEDAVRAYCKAAIAAGKEEDVADAQRWLRAALKIKPDDAQALSMLTLLLRSQGDATGAKALLDSTLAVYPAHPWALGLRAMMLRDQGNVDAALADFAGVKVDSRDLAWVSIEHAKTLAVKDPEAADKMLNQATRLLPADDPQIVQARVQIQVQLAIAGIAGAGRKVLNWVRGVVDTAAKSDAMRRIMDQMGSETLLERLQELTSTEGEQIELLRSLAKQWENRVEPREALAGLLLKQQDYAEAVKVADEGLAIAPESAKLLALKAKALALKAKVLNSKDDLTEAVRFYRRASRAAPNDDDVFADLVDVLIESGRLEEGLKEVQHRLSQSPGNGRAIAEKGRLLFAAGRLDEAAAALAAAEPLVPASARFLVRMQLGQTCRNMDRYDEALQAFRRAADEDNETSDAHAYAAAALMEIAEYNEAAKVLEQAIARIPADPADAQQKASLSWLWMMRGWALSQTGNAPVELRQMFQTATALDPASPHARMIFAATLLHEPDGRAEGERLMRELIAQADTAGIPKDVVGWCYYLLKQEDLAEHWLRGAIDLAPAELSTRFDLALVLLVLESGDAVKAYERATQLALERSAPRQRGLFHGALFDLNEAVQDERVNAERSQPIRWSLWEALKAAGLRAEELNRLKPDVAAEASVSRG